MNTSTITPDKPGESLWHNKTFVTLLSTAFFQSLASKIFALALPLLVFELTQSSQWMGWMRAIEFLPNLLLALFMGVVIDRVNRKHWSLVMLAVQVILFTVVVIVVWRSGSWLWLLFPLAFLINAANYGYNNAKLGIIKQAIEPYQQNLAIARFTSLQTVLDAFGPLMTGLLLMIASFFWPMAIVGVLFLIALIAFSRLAWREPTQTRSNTSLMQSLGEGWQQLKTNKPMLHICWLVVVINTTSGVFEIQAIYAAKALLELTAWQIGSMLSIAGICALAGSSIAPYVRKKFGLGAMLIACVIIEGAALLLPVWQLNLYSLTIALALTSFFGVMASICIWSYRQESTPSEYLGRVAGITGSIFKLGLPFGLAASGYLVVWLGAQWLFLLCAIAQLLAVSLMLLSPLRAIK